ncbi:hypothetical protein IV102_19190 [bacterium]|nr:hypothetical protein [bacterium]
MTRLAVFFLCLMGLISLALAGERVAEMRVGRNGNKVSLRITARNPDKQLRGPVRIRLYARTGKRGPWLLIKTWKERALPPHHKICRDYFDDNSLLLRMLASRRTLYLKSEVSAPGLRGVAEQTLVQR